jgi:hypothetical protein
MAKIRIDAFPFRSNIERYKRIQWAAFKQICPTCNSVAGQKCFPVQGEIIDNIGWLLCSDGFTRQYHKDRMEYAEILMTLTD